MKKLLILILTLALALGLTACGETSAPQQNAEEPQTAQEEPQTSPEEQEKPEEPDEDDSSDYWELSFDMKSYTKDVYSEDNQLIGTKTSYIPVYSLIDENGEPFTGTEPGQGVPEDEFALCSTFNSAVESVGYSDDDFAAAVREEYEFCLENNMELRTFINEISTPSIYQNIETLNVIIQSYYEIGGPHPTRELRALNFDLTEASFYTLMSLTDEPEAMKQAVVSNILGQIDEMEQKEELYPNYVDIIEGTEEFETYFDADKMTVIFQEYELGSYAIGPLCFDIDYSQVIEYFNERALRLLSLSAGAPEDEYDDEAVRMAEIAELAGYWYPNGDEAATSFFYYDEDGRWTYYIRTEGDPEATEADSGVTVPAAGENYAFYAKPDDRELQSFFRFVPAAESDSGKDELLLDNGGTVYMRGE